MVNETRRLAPAQIAQDEDALAALEGITNYSPANQAYREEAVLAARAALRDAWAAEAQAEAAAATARDHAVQKEWEFHNLILGVKAQVMAQFGRDSNEVQALGLKKYSERKAPTRRTQTETASK